MPSKAHTEVARTIGIDTGKNTLHMIGLDEKGAIVLREKVSRTRIAKRFVNVSPCLIGIEAGMASHHIARELVALGHEVKQVPPAYSKPFRQGHKNDFRDAHAVAEAAERPLTRCVPIKTDEQLDLQALHRVRSRLISNRTAVINQIRGFLLEHGIPVRQGHQFLRQQLPQLLAARTDVLSPRMIRIIGDLMADWNYLDERIERVTDEIEALARADEGCQQLITVPGVGPIVSSAMVAAIGNGAAFCKGRDFAACLAWCRSKCRRVIAPSLAVSPSAETAIYVCSSSKVPVPSCYDRQVGQNIASDCGSRPQRGECIAMSWQLRLPTSWRGSLGPSWRKDAAMRPASSRVLNGQRLNRGTIKGQPQGSANVNDDENRKIPAEVCELD
jgi:transposase